MKIKHKVTTLKYLIDLKDDIHLNPSWQRGPVWTPSKQSLLIDSILRSYDVPMIYLRKCSPRATYKYEVVDGQQRLRAIWEFIDGDLTLDDNLEKVGQARIAGRNFDDLPKTMKDKFRKFRIVVAYVDDTREPEISVLFSRMQMGVRLNPPELRNAVQTGLRHAVDGLAREHSFFLKSRINPARFKHQDYLAHVISLCIHNGQRDLKAPQLMDDYETVSDPSIYGPVIADANEILDFLEKVNDRVDRRITQKWMFVDLFYVLYKNKAKLSDRRIKNFSDAYIKFESDRREYNAEPDELLIGKPTKYQRDLYDYILAFKYSGGEKQNVQQRHSVLFNHFSPVMR